MPVISRFYGIVIKIYFLQKEHNPPHLHAIYGDYTGAFDLSTTKMIEGDLPAKASAMVKEWMRRYTEELIEIWNTQEFRELPPLE